jgi:3-dehydrosphinganine reductase
VQAARQTPNQVLKAYSFSLAESDSSEKALEAACEAHGGRSPDAVFLCAGKATPGYFVEETARSLQDGMANAYWTQAWSAFVSCSHTWTRGLRSQRSEGGGAAHGQGRHARQDRVRRVRARVHVYRRLLDVLARQVRLARYVPRSGLSALGRRVPGLAETLRGELLLYDIDVHICFPGTIYSPGYVEENKTKPEITLKIEETDEGLKPEAVAERLFDGASTLLARYRGWLKPGTAGVQRGYFHISVDFITDIFRTSTRGATPFNNVVVDSLFQIIGSVSYMLPFLVMGLTAVTRLLSRYGAGEWTCWSGSTGRATASTYERRASCDVLPRPDRSARCLYRR